MNISCTAICKHQRNGKCQLLDISEETPQRSNFHAGCPHFMGQSSF